MFKISKLLIKAFSQNATSPQHYDIINIDVINSGSSDVTTKFSLYLDDTTDLVQFKSDKRITDKQAKRFSKITKMSLKPINFTGEFKIYILKQGWATSLVGGPDLLEKFLRGPH